MDGWLVDGWTMDGAGCGVPFVSFIHAMDGWMDAMPCLVSA